MTTVKHALPLIDHAQDVVVENDDFDVDTVLMECGKFLTVHHDAAVAGKEDDRRSGTADFSTHGRRKAVPHRPQSPGGNEVPRFIQVEELSRPHLMLADVGNDDRILIGRT